MTAEERKLKFKEIRDFWEKYAQSYEMNGDVNFLLSEIDRRDEALREIVSVGEHTADIGHKMGTNWCQGQAEYLAKTASEALGEKE